MLRTALSLGLAAVLPLGAQVFRAGAAASNITPPLGLPIVGGFDPVPAEHVHDELHARALVLDDGRTRLAIVIADNLAISRSVHDAAKRAIREKTGIPESHILMAATHTHSSVSARRNREIAPQPLDDYQRFLASRLTDAVRRAVHNLEPARIAHGSASAPEHVFNRRWFLKPESPPRNPFGGFDKVQMNPRRGDPALVEPAGPTDPEIRILSVQSKDGRPIALLANYSLHYVGGVPAHEISADYYGMFAARIAELLGTAGQDPPFVAMLSNGTSGNINNIDFRDPAPPKYKPYEKMRLVADDVARKVASACRGLAYRTDVPLGAAAKEIQLAVRTPGPKEIAWAEATLKSPPKLHRLETAYARRVLDMREWPATASIPLQALRVGDAGIAAIPFEVFVETGLEIKKRSPLPRSFTIELANGGYGYLPTPEHHALGGYETWLGTNFFEVQASRKITETVLELLGGLR